LSKLRERENEIEEKVNVSSGELENGRMKVRERRERRRRSIEAAGQPKLDRVEIQVSEEVLLRQAREKEPQILGRHAPKVERRVKALVRLYG